MSPSPSQEQPDASKPKGPAPNDNMENDQMPSPPPTSAQEPPTKLTQPSPTTQDPSNHSPPPHRSSSVQPPSFTTDASALISQNASISTNGRNPQSKSIQNDQASLQQGQDIGVSKDALEAYDWDALEEKFHAEMEICAKREVEIQAEFDELLHVSPSLQPLKYSDYEVHSPDFGLFF